MLLQLAGHETHMAHDGVEAIEAAKRFRPDIVLLDIGLPRLNGYEVCRRLRERAVGKGPDAGGPDRLGQRKTAIDPEKPDLTPTWSSPWITTPSRRFSPQCAQESERKRLQDFTRVTVQTPARLPRAGSRVGQAMPVRYDGSTVTVYEKTSNLTFDRRYAYVMRPLRYSINVTLDGCCDHRAIPADEDLHRHAVENLAQADALLFGRVTYEMMEAAWRPPARTGEA